MDVNIAAIVTDNGSNILRAVSNLEWPNFTFSTSTPEICKALGRCKKLASHFHHFPKSSNLLNK